MKSGMLEGPLAATIGAFTFRKLDEACAREIAGWRYDPPYDIYNCAPDELEESARGLLNPEYRYYSVWDQAGQLVGYCGFGEDGQVPGGDYAEDALDLGGGLKPDRTGRGLGIRFMQAVVEFAHHHYASAALRTTVAAFNKRALRLCEQAGFHPVQTFENTDTREPFVVLMRDAE